MRPMLIALATGRRSLRAGAWRQRGLSAAHPNALRSYALWIGGVVGFARPAIPPAPRLIERCALERLFQSCARACCDPPVRRARRRSGLRLKRGRWREPRRRRRRERNCRRERCGRWRDDDRRRRRWRGHCCAPANPRRRLRLSHARIQGEQGRNHADIPSHTHPLGGVRNAWRHAAHTEIDGAAGR
jgi:hypothetical protein